LRWSSRDGFDRQDGHLLCNVHSSIACLVCTYGGTLARWMTPGLGFCRAIKFQGKEGLLLFRRVENMNMNLTVKHSNNIGIMIMLLLGT
jgi:hypothetical protein